MFRTVAAALLFSLSSHAMAAGWTAERVRGDVLVEAGAGWEQVQRGVEIGDGARLKTGANGRVDLSRGKDHFSLGANTSVEIRDSGPDLMTSVVQSSGVVSVDVERRNVQHFSVQTPFLAAVVKGTKFTVTSDSSGSHVDVDRGVVQVQDSSNDLVADVHPGQTADVTNEAPLQVEGAGATPVYTSQGVIVSTTGNRETPAKAGTTEVSTGQKQSGQSGSNGNGNAGGGNNGNGNGNGNGGGNNGNGNGNGGGNNGNGNGNGGGNSGNGNGNGSGNNGNGNGNGGGNSGNGGGNSGNGNGNGGGNSGNGNGNGGGNSGNSSENSSSNNGNGNGNSGSNNGNGSENSSGNNGNGNGGGNSGNNGNGNGRG